MPHFLRKPAILTLTMIAMWLALITLVILQVRWSNQLSEAYEQRLQSTLNASAESFRADFQADLSALCRSVQTQNPDSIVTLPLSPLPFRLYFIAADSDQLNQFDRTLSRLIPVPWPTGWDALRSELDANAEDLAAASARRWFNRPWLASSAIPAVFRAVALSSATSDASPANRLNGFFLVELDLPALATRYFPPADNRFFSASGLETRISVSFLGRNVYDSQPVAPLAARALHSLDLLALPALPNSPRFNLRSAADESPWLLEARHRAGTLDAAVSALRLRNLASGLAVSLVLCVGLVFLVITNRRTQQLARLQGDFVAGFSHELRTPITAICMLAENLRDGLPATSSDVQRYGTLLLEQGQRLRSRIEDILAFASSRNQSPYLQPVSLHQLVASVLAEEASLLIGFTIENQVSPELPQALADLNSLKSCLANLLGNAAKYAKSAAWIGISAEVSNASTLTLTVSDHGPGIDPADLPQLFDPFFRGQRARSERIPGSGLGLHLVRSRMAAMGGRITMDNQPGRGCSLTLHLKSIQP